MTCLACGGPAALETVLSPHELAGLLCLDHLLAALEPTTPVVPWRVRGVNDRRCQGLLGTCPRPVERVYLNASWCGPCAPPDGPPSEPAISRGSDNGPDDGMSEAVLTLMDAFSLTILEVWPHPYGAPDDLEGS